MNPKLSSSIDCETAQVWAPSNIALVKYWGKRDEILNLPTHGSLSLSLGHCGTQTKLSWKKDLCEDQIIFNGRLLKSSEAEASRLTAFLDLFRPGEIKGAYSIETENNIPTAAGLASSASGFAALVKALNILHGWNLSLKELSCLARLGSGSAARSLYEGFSIWHEGEKADGSDSFAEKIDAPWKELRWLVFMPSKEKKALSSRLAMKQTALSCPWFDVWVNESKKWLKMAHEAILSKDFSVLGSVMEASTLAMHASMLCSDPWNLYWKAETVEMMHKVKNLRSLGIEAYFTMDAGPSVKILYLEKNESQLQEMVKDIEASKLLWINPWIFSKDL